MPDHIIYYIIDSNRGNTKGVDNKENGFIKYHEQRRSSNNNRSTIRMSHEEAVTADQQPPSKRLKYSGEHVDDQVQEEEGDIDNIRSIVTHSLDNEKHHEQQQQKQQLRSSTLPSPTLALTGHKGSIYSLKYSPNGDILCSTSFDMTCLLWDHTQRYENIVTLNGHKNAVLDCSWCDDETIVTVSADKTVQLWDVEVGQRLRKWTNQHTSIVNTCSTAPNGSCINYIASGSDDGTCCIWDRRQKYSIATLQTDYPVLGVAITNFDNTNVGPQVFTAGIDNKITCWDIRQQRKIYSMKGHTDTITSLAIQPTNETHLLSNSMDQTIRIWDIQPLAINTNRCCKTFTGHKHNSEKGLLKCSWSADSSMISAGSSDRYVHVWDEYSTEELYLLPGHKGCVNTVTFHPHETNVIASGASDNIIYVGELS